MANETETTPAKQQAVRFNRSPFAPSMYVEGVSQVMVGFPNSRVLWHSTVHKQADGTETRDIACEMVLPTAGLAECARQLLTQLALNKDVLKSAGTDWLQNTLAVIQSLEPIPGVDPGITEDGANPTVS